MQDGAPMLAIIFGFSSAAAWGCADFLGGLKNRVVALTAIAVTSQLAGLVATLGLIAIVGETAPPRATLAWAALTGVANTAGLLAFYRGLAVGRMSVVAPIVGMSAIVPVVAGLVMGERPATLQVLGIVVGVLGVVLASRHVDAPREAAVARGPRDARGLSIALAVVAAAGVGGNLLGLQAAVSAGDGGHVLWALAGTRATSLVILLVLAAATRQPVRPGLQHVGAIVGLGLLDLGANVLYALATEHTLLSVAAVLASMHPVFTVVLARIVLAERIRGIQAAGVGLAVVGAALIGGG
jgi:drug/metabolite transporter (DMT)-like permease